MGLTGRIWEVPDEVTADLVRTTAKAGGDAVFVSCTNLPTYDVIAPLEEELGRPVLTANQVTMWAALARGRAVRSADEVESLRGQRLTLSGCHGLRRGALALVLSTIYAGRGGCDDDGRPALSRAMAPRTTSRHSRPVSVRPAGRLERARCRWCTPRSARTRTGSMRSWTSADTSGSARAPATLAASHPLDSLMWACTSGSFVFGWEGAHRQVEALAEATGLPTSSTSLAFVSRLPGARADAR